MIHRIPLGKVDSVIDWYRSLGDKRKVGAAWLLIPVIFALAVASFVLFLVSIPRFITDSIVEGKI